MQVEGKRPVSVTIIAILGIISGIVGLIIGIVLAILAPALNYVTESDILEDDRFSDVNSTDIVTSFNEFKVLSGYFFILGIILIALSIASFIVSWGLLKGKGWAWNGAVILNIISIILGVIMIAFLGVGDITDIVVFTAGFIKDGVILWYLYRQNVRSYFGREKVQAS